MKSGSKEVPESILPRVLVFTDCNIVIILYYLIKDERFLLREGIKKIDFFLGKSPKLWVGGGQES